MFRDAEGQLRNGVAKTNYTHDFLIDAIIANPAIDQRDLARSLGYSEAWISMIMASDSFQAKFTERQKELVDPVMRQSLDTQFKALVLQSAEVLRRKLEANQNETTALKVLDTAAKALGYGARVKVEGTVHHSHSLVGLLSSLPPATPPVSQEKVLNPLPSPEPAK